MSKLTSMTRRMEKLWLLGTEFLQDMVIYTRGCGMSPWQDANLRRFYRLLIQTHTVEKGLSLPEPRSMFGKPSIEVLMRELDAYDVSLSPLPAQMLLGSLQSYIEKHRAEGIEDPFLDKLEAYVRDKTERLGIVPNPGLRRFDTAYEDVTALPPAAFLTSRFSSRTMRPEPLPRDLVTRIASIAQSAPSQCNRQATHAHFYQSSDRIEKLLALQGGSRGFSQGIGNLFVITSDLAAWSGAQQRNQPYVDGGLFAMSLMYALHAHGVAACPLNLAVANGRERQIKRAGDIPMDRRVVVMLAAGWPMSTQGVSAAGSPRRATEEILHFES